MVSNFFLMNFLMRFKTTPLLIDLGFEHTSFKHEVAFPLVCIKKKDVLIFS